MASLKFTRRALFDLEDIYDYSISKYGQIVTDKYMNDIEEALKTISEHPKILRHKPFAKHTCFFPVREHVLIFSVLDDVLYLLMINRNVMDIESLIKRLEPSLIHEAQILHDQLKNTIK